MDLSGASRVVEPPTQRATDAGASARQPPPARSWRILSGPFRSRRRPTWWALVLVVLLALAGAGYLATRDPGPAPITRADVQRAVDQGVEQARKDARAAPPDAGTAYRTAQPSIVTIEARGSGTQGSRSTGAGVVVSTDGTILTALHVVAGAESVQVTFADGTASNATVRDQQASSDTAVLRPTRLPEVVVPAVFSGGLQVGDPVFALGHPLGLRGSLSAGVVSSMDRSIRVSAGRTLSGLIQFDAAVNPGNSGGPLLDRDGHVVGIVTGLANPSEQNFFVGIGFAVPIATAGGVAGSPPQ